MLVARAKPDGHTLMQATSTTMAINVTLAKKLAYDPAKDFVPVALLTASPFVLTVSADSPVKSVADLIALAKAKPGELNYGSAGPGTDASSEHRADAEPHRHAHAARPVQGDAAGAHRSAGRADAGAVRRRAVGGAANPARASCGRWRCRRRSARRRLPDVPTMQEAGIAGFESAAWQMIVAPAGTPPEIVALLNKEVRAIFSEPEVIKELTQARHGTADDRHRRSSCKRLREGRDRALERRSWSAPAWRGRNDGVASRALRSLRLLIGAVAGAASTQRRRSRHLRREKGGQRFRRPRRAVRIPGRHHADLRARAGEAAGGPLLVLYVLPVEAHDEKRWGDARAEIAKLDLADRYGVDLRVPDLQPSAVVRRPSERSAHPAGSLFPERGACRSSSAPIRRGPSATARALLGFSKSGWGAWTLLLRHPDMFGRAAAWDAPMTMEVSALRHGADRRHAGEFRALSRHDAAARARRRCSAASRG